MPVVKQGIFDWLANVEHAFAQAEDEAARLADGAARGSGRRARRRGGRDARHRGRAGGSSLGGRDHRGAASRATRPCSASRRGRIRRQGSVDGIPVRVATSPGRDRRPRLPCSDARARHRRRRLHRLALRQAPRRRGRRGRRARQAHVRRQPGQPRRASTSQLVVGDIADAEAVARAGRGCDAVVNFAAETHVDRSILAPREFVAHRRRRHEVPARMGARRRAPATSRSRPTRCTATSRRAAARARTIRCGRRARTAPRRRAATCRCSPTSAPTASTPRSRAARTPTGRTSTRRSWSRCSSRTRSTGEPLPVYGDGKQVREWLHVEDHCAGDRARPARGRPGRGLQRRRRGAREHRGDAPDPRADRRRPVARSGTSRIAPATTAATRSTTRSCARSAGRPQHSFGEGGLRETVDWYRENRGLVGADQDRASTAPTTRSSTPTGSRPEASDRDHAGDGLDASHISARSLASLAVAVARGDRRERGGPAPTPSLRRAAPVFVLAGGGWGHGVGMSQWGASARRRPAGPTRDILAHYYPGTTLDEGAARRDACACCSPTARAAARSRRRRRSRSRDAAGSAHAARRRRARARAAISSSPSDGEADARCRARSRSAPARRARRCRSSGKGYRGELAVDAGRQGLQVVDVVGARAVPPRCRPRRDAEGLARRGAEGAGGRGAHLRAREHRQGQAVRPLRRLRSQVYYGVEASHRHDRGRA